jgi:CRP-like cAMP-binding protein
MALPALKMQMPPVDETLELLRSVDAFTGYNEEDLRKIVDIMECNKYDLDESIVSFGCASNNLHIVLEGAGKVSIPRQVGQVSRGDVFGEEALRLAGAISPHQVEAVGGAMTTISVNQALFNKLDIRRAHLGKTNQKEKLARAIGEVYGSESEHQQEGISQDSGRKIVSDYEQTMNDGELIMQAVKNNKVLSEVLQLTDGQYDLIRDCVHLISVPKGEVLMRKGDTGHALYILQEGLLDIFLSGTVEEGAGDFKLRAGDSFGELALLYDTPRAATISAVRDSWLWVLDRSEFKMVTRMNYTARISAYTKLIENIPFLDRMVDKGHHDMIAGILEEIFVAQTEDICTIGEDAGFLFIIYEGECEAHKADGSARTLQAGDWIGERQLEQNIPADETLIVTSESVTALVLDRNSLHLVTKAVHSMKRTSSLISPTSTGIEKGQYADQFLRRRVSRSNIHHGQSPKAQENVLAGLVPCGLLGEGSFGTVYLLADSSHDRKFALKGLYKERIVKENLSKIVANERSVMALLNSDFVVRLVRTYQDASHVFFLLEAVMGGELFDVYSDNDLFGSMDHARFYIGCVTLALSHLHLHRVIYRDLKLENCLLDDRGYVKITDMGIAKLVMGKTYTMCGTADYFAPETLKQSGYNRAVDWWACGVLMFIMVAGRSPFDAPEVTQIYKNIMKGFSKVKFPANFNSDIIDTIKSLCRKKPEERVPMMKGGIENLISMPFFSGLDWMQLEQRQVDPPFKPTSAKVTERKASRAMNFSVDSIVDWDGTLPDAHSTRPPTPPVLSRSALPETE